MKKQCGKFIKKDSNVLKVASIKDFSFEDIATTPIVTFDNKERSLIHTNLHSSKVIEGIVNPENRCDIDLVDTSNERGLLWPVDFTQEVVSGEEYSNICKNYKNYEQSSSSEDTIQYEKLIPENAELDELSDFNSDLVDFHSNKKRSVETKEVDKKLDVSNDTKEEETKEDSKEDDGFSSLTFKQDNSTEEKIDTTNKLDSTNTTTLVEESVEEKLNTVLEAESYLNKDLSDTHQKDVSDKSDSEYNRGYNQAKEEISKSLEQERSKINETITLITDNFKNIVEGLSGLKKSILDSANKNFYEISQAISENLLKKEFSINPESFALIINQALSNMDNNNIKVKVSHNMYEKLNSLSSEVSTNLKNILEEDNKISDGDFKIESDINAIDGSIHNIVTKLLDEYDLNLFQKEETKDSSKVEKKVEVESEELNKVS